MAERGLKEKLGWKPAMRTLLVALPKGVADPFAGVEHGSVPAGARLVEDAYDLLLGFVWNAAELELVAQTMLSRATAQSKIWLCYPKISSRAKSDLRRDAGWTPMFDAGWIVVAIASVDNTWSAVRFRPKTLVKSVRFPKTPP